MAIIAKFTRTLPAPTATISGGFVFLLSAGWFTQANTGAAGSPIGGGTNSIANGGGDMQIFSDTAATTQLPIEVVTFVTGVSPQCQVWVRTPSYTTGDTITIGKDDTQTVQPVVGAAFGRNATWVDLNRGFDGGDLRTDVSGNITAGTFVGTEVTGNDSTGNYTTFNGNNVYIKQNSIGTQTSLTLSAVIDATPDTDFKYIFCHSDYAANSRLYFGLDGNEDLITRIGSTVKTTTPALSNLTYVSAVISGGQVAHYVNGQKIGVSSSYTGNAGSSLANSTAIGAYSQSNGANNSHFNGNLYRLHISSSARGDDYILSEYTNQNDPDNFGTSSEYVLVGGGGLTLVVPSITSGESFGLPDVILNTAYLLPSAITTAESFGVPTVASLDQFIQAISVSSLEAFGEPLILTGGVTLAPTSITSQESLGTPFLVYSQLVLVDSITSEESFGIAIISDGVALVIPVGDRDTYQKIAEYLRATDKFVSYQNNEILLEWLRSEGIDEGSFNDSFKEYWNRKGYVGAYNDRWKSWKGE